MDTRFWGPSGWRLLHSVSFSPEVGLADLRTFFTLLAYVLPCKFCRVSYSKYITEHPFPAARADVGRWLWTIHNCVNAKLRSQGLAGSASPTFASVRRAYTERVGAGCSRTEFEGWEFLFAIAENHPFSRSMAGSLPIGGGGGDGGDDFEHNKMNTLAPSIRMKYYRRFWEILPDVLPFKEWAAAWKAAPPLSVGSRISLLRSLWRVRHSMEKELDLLNRDVFQNLCKRLVSARSSCERKQRRRTCRRGRKRSRQTKRIRL